MRFTSAQLAAVATLTMFGGSTSAKFLCMAQRTLSISASGNSYPSPVCEASQGVDEADARSQNLASPKTHDQFGEPHCSSALNLDEPWTSEVMTASKGNLRYKEGDTIYECALPAGVFDNVAQSDWQCCDAGDGAPA